MIIHQTQRLFLETWVLEDFEAFASIARDPQVMRFIAEGNTWPDSRIEWFIGQQIALQEALGFCNWKLTDRISKELVGFCGLAPLHQINEIEIGWWLRPAHWKKGLALEAAKCVVSAALKDHAIERLVARAYLANTSSVILMERLGMIFDRVLETNHLGEVVLYTLNKKETTPC